MDNIPIYAKNLYLMRHAAARLDVSPDRERPLTPEGERDARHMGRWYNRTLQPPDKIIASPALRTRTTAEILMEELQQRHAIHIEQGLYDASVRTFLEVVNNLDDTYRTVLIIAHNPSITYLADYLADQSIIDMSPATIVGLGFELDSWQEVSQRTAHRLVIKRPNQLQ